MQQTRARRTKPPALSLGRIRHHNIGRMLLDSFRLFSQRMLAHLHAHGFTDLRPIHTALLRNIDAAGTRITEIGERSSMTKQAVGQLIKECEQLGYLRSSQDPVDRRARIVRFTPKGARFLAALPQVFQAATSDIEAIIGRDRMDSLAETLEMLAVPNAAAPDANGAVRGATGVSNRPKPLRRAPPV